MASLPYPLNRLYNHGRVGMAGMPYPPTDCHSYIKINMTTYLQEVTGNGSRQFHLHFVDKETWIKASNSS